MNQSSKLSLFLDLGCKPMKDVILRTPREQWHCPNSTIDKLERMHLVISQMRKEIWEMTNSVIRMMPHQYIEAIPGKVGFEQMLNNFNSLNLQDTLWYSDWNETWWEHIEASYD